MSDRFTRPPYVQHDMPAWQRYAIVTGVIVLGLAGAIVVYVLR